METVIITCTVIYVPHYVVYVYIDFTICHYRHHKR